MTCQNPICDDPACESGKICNSAQECVAQCIPNKYTACYGGDVYYYDSCDYVGNRYEDCTYSCVETSSTTALCIIDGCEADGSICQYDGECCHGNCDTDKNDGLGVCVSGSSGGFADCPSSFQISGAQASLDAGCVDNCVDHLDWDSQRIENGVKVETSVGEPNTFNGVCLAIKGVIYNDETDQTLWDECVGEDGNTVKKWVIDGDTGDFDDNRYALYPCIYGCHDGACRTSSTCKSETIACNANSECCEGYCSYGYDDIRQAWEQGYCCGAGEFYSAADKTCYKYDPCGLSPKPCWYRPPNDPNGWQQSSYLGSSACISTTTKEACCYFSTAYGQTNVYYPQDIVVY